MANAGVVAQTNGVRLYWPNGDAVDATTPLPVTTAYSSERVATKTIAFDGEQGPSTAATLSTALTGANNDLDFTAVTAGADGNDITIRYVDPGTGGAALSVGVVNTAITVNLATSAAVAATAVLTSDNSDDVTDGDTLTIGAIVYRFKNAMTQAYDIQRNGVTDTLDFLIAAINGTGTPGNEYFAGTVAHPDVTASVRDGFAFTVTAKVAGVAGNSIAKAENSLPLDWDGAGAFLTGGVDSGTITSTAAQVDAAIDALPAAAALVTPANKAANDGTGVVTAMAATALTGGKSPTATLFTVTGVVGVKLFARCTESLAGATATVAAGTALTTAGLIAQTTGTDIDINEIWHDATPDASVELTTVLTEKIVAQDIIQTIGTAAVTDGTLVYYCTWRPISSDGAVVAA